VIKTLWYVNLSFAVIFCSCTKKSDKINLPSDTPIKTENTPSATPPIKAEAQPLASQPSSTPQPTTAEVQSLRVSGQIASVKQGQASFKVPGHIEKISVQVGERVKAGAVLAKLDDADYLLRVRLAKNSVELADVALNQAKRDAQREEMLKKENATTVANLEKQNNSLANAQIQLSQAQLNLQIAQKALTDTKLQASFDGVISKRIKIEGEYVAIGNSVLEVSAVDDYEVNLRVPESSINRVKMGDLVPLKIPSTLNSLTMKVIRIVPVIQEQSRTFEVIGKIQTDIKNNQLVFPGQFVEAIFE
jgi:RND family efflux transporter MFP subunit